MSAYVKEKPVFDKLDNNFIYHKPIADQSGRYEAILSAAKELAILLETSCPTSRELSLAMTNLEQAVMWANYAIANESEKEV